MSFKTTYFPASIALEDIMAAWDAQGTGAGSYDILNYKVIERVIEGGLALGSVSSLTKNYIIFGFLGYHAKKVRHVLLEIAVRRPFRLNDLMRFEKHNHGIYMLEDPFELCDGPTHKQFSQFIVDVRDFELKFDRVWPHSEIKEMQVAHA